jgi:hypothetical protein
VLRYLWCHSLKQVPHWFTLTTENIERREGWTKKALRTHLETLEELESALLEFEESIGGEAQERPQERGEGWSCSRYRSFARSWEWARVGSTGAYAAGRSQALSWVAP